MPHREAIAQFWSWWPELVRGHDQRATAAALEQDHDLLQRVAAIHPKIQVVGEYQPGGPSWLCLSSRGNLEVRHLTELWRAQRPPDPSWEFMTARPVMWPPKRPSSLSWQELVVTTQVDDLREVLHVGLHHATFAAMEEVQARQLAFMALDGLLGEDAVERWIGSIGILVEAPTDAEPIESLRGGVAQLAERATGEAWQALSQGRKAMPTLVTVNRALKPIDHVDLPIHTRIDLQLLAPGPRGLPQGKEELALVALQDELMHLVGARAVVIARESHAGHRIIHLHGDESVAPVVASWRQAHSDWEMSVLSQPDPQWDILRRWD